MEWHTYMPIGILTLLRTWKDLHANRHTQILTLFRPWKDKHADDHTRTNTTWKDIHVSWQTHTDLYLMKVMEDTILHTCWWHGRTYIRWQIYTCSDTYIMEVIEGETYTLMDILKFTIEVMEWHTYMLMAIFRYLHNWGHGRTFILMTYSDTDTFGAMGGYTRWWRSDTYTIEVMEWHTCCWTYSDTYTFEAMEGHTCWRHTYVHHWSHGRTNMLMNILRYLQCWGHGRTYMLTDRHLYYWGWLHAEVILRYSYWWGHWRKYMYAAGHIQILTVMRPWKDMHADGHIQILTLLRSWKDITYMLMYIT